MYVVQNHTRNLCSMEVKAFLLLCAFAALSSCQCASISIGKYTYCYRKKNILDVLTLYKACKTTRADIALILDASGSVGTANYNKALQFLQNLVASFSIATNNEVRVGVITYSTTSSISFNLDKYSTKASLQSAISKLPYTGGLTNTPAALQDAITLLKTSSYGGHPEPVPNIAIIFTGRNI